MSSPSSRSTRRTLLTAAWAAPVAVVATSAPAVAASNGTPTNYGLNANTGIHPNDVEANPRAWSYPEIFTDDTYWIEITISYIGDDPAFSLIDRADDQPGLNDWVPLEETPTRVVLRAPVAIASTGGNTPSTAWYWNVAAEPGTITVDGRIDGTDLEQFDEGQQVGP
ncbi:hypothetical protein [Brachybacterium sp. YJGR34]|uniref:hypothetical protein n=1 Tax=Brachybacterium sp. YJGR34 TaxID=2059911 RepID=UPI000E0A83B6|nr:hypothetical protein [Brachybacterium sp. YJGR34]